MLLIDNNLSPRLSRELKEKFPGMIHVADIGLENEDDSMIWQYAQENDLHILTKDKDFNNIQSLRGFPPKIIWLRMGNVSTKYIIRRIKENYTMIEKFIKDKNIGIIQI